MKIDFEIYFDGDIQIVDKPKVLEQLREKFKHGYLDATIQNPWQWKTREHMGFFFGRVAQLCQEWLTDAGYNFSSKYEAIKYVMENFPSDGLGVSDKWVEIGVKDGRVVRRAAKSIAAMGRAELHELAEDITKLLLEHGIEVESPESFKTHRKYDND